MEFAPNLLKLLPEKSRAKLMALADEREDKYAVLRAAVATQESAWQRRDAAEMAVRNWQQNFASTVARKATPEEIAASRAPVERAEAEIERATARVKTAQAAWEAYSFLDEVHSQLVDCSRTGIRLVERPLPAVKRSDYHRAVEESRRALDEVTAEIENLSGAPLTIEEMRAKIEEEIDGYARAPVLSVRARENSPVPIVAHLSPPRYQDPTRTAVVHDPLPSLVWFLRDVILEKAVGMLPTEEPPGALPSAQREKRIDELTARRLEIEFEEEAIVCAAAAAGIPLERRRDADWRAVCQAVERN